MQPGRGLGWSASKARLNGSTQRTFQLGKLLSACHHILQFLWRDLPSFSGSERLTAIEHGEAITNGKGVPHHLWPEYDERELFASPDPR